MNWSCLRAEANHLRTQRMKEAAAYRLLSQSWHRKTASQPRPGAVCRDRQAVKPSTFCVGRRLSHGCAIAAGLDMSPK